MIRFSDAFILAYTKLRVHKIRTGVAVGISGILFGLIALVIIVAEGAFSSVDNFSDVGLNNRTVLNVTRSGGTAAFNEYEKRADPAFVSEVEAAHKALVVKKTAAAKKFGVSYVASAEDPSPITIDPQSKQKVIKETALNDSIVQELTNTKRIAEYVPFDVKTYLQKYPSSSVIQAYKPVQPQSGSLTYMKEGKESFKQNSSPSSFFGSDGDSPSLTVLEASLSKPFISNKAFDARKGEVPVIVPYGSAEKLLGLKKLKAGASTQEKLDRLNEVRRRIGEVKATYCYRNPASNGLLARAVAQQDDIKQGAADKDYVKPALIYAVPSEKDCGAVTIASDTRSATQKKQDAQQLLYEKEVGQYVGEPEQHLVTVRGVGISSDVGSSGQWSVAYITQALFSSSLGYGTWTIPADLLAQLPKESRPAAIFENNPKTSKEMLYFMYESYLVDFSDKDQARALLRSGTIGSGGANEVYAYPFGSGILVVDELKTAFTNILLWVLIVVGGVAVIILAGIIGRTVSEGRRESSIFRAIGASRLDVGAIYGTYVLLLSLRVIVFAAVLSIALALTVEALFWRDATLGAQLAYASTDVTKQFHLFSLNSPYLLLIAATILVASMLASIVPILLGARRNPIKDMRNDA
jgi:uncharacterized membrane protein